MADYRLPVLRKFQHLVHASFARAGYGITRLSFPSKVLRHKLVQQIRRDRTLLITSTEAWTLSALVESVRKIPGDMAEIGTFLGASAALIASSAPDRAVHVFDTFEGLPQPGASEESLGEWSHAGALNAGYDGVKRYLSKWRNISLYKGEFPRCAPSFLNNSRFSFVHLDVDLYRGTRESLEWFYPRMSRGGILLTHDYSFCDGVRRAFDEFFADKPEPMIELPTNQCMMVKL
jgi:O-methyltransferase